MSEESKNGILNLLNTLAASGDNWVKLITLALIVVSGGGNFFATKQVAKLSEHEAQQAARELHELHSGLTQALERQKEMIELLRKNFR